MLDGLSKFGLPVKYAIIGFIGGVIGVFLSNLLGISSEYVNYIMTPVAGGIGGAIGGWLRQRKGKAD